MMRLNPQRMKQLDPSFQSVAKLFGGWPRLCFGCISVVLLLVGGGIRVKGAAGTEKVAGHEVLQTFRISEIEAEGVRATAPFLIVPHGTSELWFAGGLGLYSFDETRYTWVDRGKGLREQASRVWVQTIGWDKTGRLWICHGGTVAFLADGQWHDLKELAPSNIGARGSWLVPAADGTVWFLSLKGLISFDGVNWGRPASPSQQIVDAFDALDARNLNAQERIRARSMGLDDELPPPWQSTVSCGFADREGSVWLGSRLGVLRYDSIGDRWMVYRTRNLTLGASRVWEDRYGRIWFADNGYNIARYDRRTDMWNQYDLGQRFPGEAVCPSAIYVDRAGAVMIATQLGIILMDDKTGEMTPTTVHIDGELRGVSAIIEDTKGRIWVGAGDAILILRN